jgi:hypothetical protein
MNSLAQECEEDKKRLCADVKPGGGRTHQCILDKKEELSEGCRKAEFTPEMEVGYGTLSCTPCIHAVMHSSTHTLLCTHPHMLPPAACYSRSHLCTLIVHCYTVCTLIVHCYTICTLLNPCYTVCTLINHCYRDSTPHGSGARITIGAAA